MLNRRNKQVSTLFILLCLILSSCNINEFTEIDKIIIKPKITLPLAYGEIQIDSLLFRNITDNSSIYIASDNLIHFKIEKKNLFSFSSNEFVSAINLNNTQKVNFADFSTILPNFSLFNSIDNKTLPFPSINFNNNLNLETISASNEFKTIKFKSGIISITIQNNFPTDILWVKLSINNVNSKTEFLNFSLSDIPAGGSKTMEMYVDEKNMDNEISISMQRFQTKITQPIEIKLSNYNFTVKTELKNIKFHYVKGNLGNKEINIPSGKFKLFEDFIENDYLKYITFGSPEIKLKSYSNVGIETGININLRGVNNITNKEYSLAKADTISSALSNDYDLTTVVTSLDSIILNQNDGIVNLIDIAPTNIFYSGNIKLNPSSKLNNNFVLADSDIRVDLIADIPFNIKINNLSIKDTTKLDLKDLEQLDSLTLKLKYVNGLPISVNLSILTLNDLGVITDSIKLNNPIKSASVYSEGSNKGKIEKPNEGTSFLTMSETQRENLLNAKSIIFNALVNTSTDDSNSPVVVPLLGNSKLKITILVDTNIEYNVKP